MSDRPTSEEEAIREKAKQLIGTMGALVGAALNHDGVAVGWELNKLEDGLTEFLCSFDRASRAAALRDAVNEARSHHGEPMLTKVQNWLCAEAARLEAGE